jgi:hypothetical protein
MATRKQTQAAKRNVNKAQKAAADQKTIAHLPADAKSALGNQGAAVAQRKRADGTSPKPGPNSTRSRGSASFLAGRKWAGTN